MSEIPVFGFALREDLKEEKQFLPTRATPKSAGWDVRAATEDRKPITLRAGQYFKIPLGVRGLCPPGWWYELKPRSSTFGKKFIHALYGTIDEDYEGQLLFAGQYIPDINVFAKDLTIEWGEAIGQIVPVKRHEMKVVEYTNQEIDHAYEFRNSGVEVVRGAGGFGSTDTKK